MHHLKALIWKSYKVRLRSPLTSALDVAGPIVIIGVYICLKLVLGIISGPNLQPELDHGNNLFRNLTPGEHLSGRLADLVCTKVLYFSDSSSADLERRLAQQCALELVKVGSRDELVYQLSRSLEARISHTGNEDLSWNNSRRSPNGCFSVPGRAEPLYQLGIKLTSRADQNLLEIHSTDSAGHRVIYQPYTQGSNYNEYRFPQSDLNSGLHLIGICARQALSPTRKRPSNSTTSDPPLQLKAFPVIAASQVSPILFLVFQLAAMLCNSIATVVRTSDDNESGLRHYIRLSGVPAIYFWLSQLIVICIHMSIQCLIMAIVLSWPLNSELLDPISEANITLRWLLLLTYGLAINVYAQFIGSIFYKTSQALLVTCLLAVAYAMYPLTFMVQWNPYRFSPYTWVINLMLANPVSNYEALLTVLYGVQLQSTDSLNWSHLNSGINGGGMSDLSIASLWLLLILQALFWFCMTILVDQFHYSSSYWPKGILTALAELLGLRCLFEPTSSGQTRASDKKYPAKLAAGSGADPNRVCCSLRSLSVLGPSILTPLTKGNPLKMNHPKGSALEKRKLNRDKQVSESLNTTHRLGKSPSLASKITSKLSPLDGRSTILDEAIQQHIAWHRSRVALENVNIDFRFNQITFVLGSTNLKELLFSALLGLHTIQSGTIVLDEKEYSPTNIFMARPHIGYLSERDVFLNEMSIFENLQLFGSLRDPSYTRYDSESSFLLNLLHLASRRDHLPAALTTRSARKLALAVAAVGHTKLLLLVEPTLSLHWRPRCQVLNLLSKYKSIRSIVVDTSDVDEATTFGDRIVLLRAGRIDLDESPEKLADRTCCGYWIVFEPVAATTRFAQPIDVPASATLGLPTDKHKERRPLANYDNIKALELLTTEVFKQDKIDQLDATRCSFYQELINTSHHVGSDVKDHSRDSGQHPIGDNSRGSILGLESRTPESTGIKLVENEPTGGVNRLSGSGIILKVRHSSRIHQALSSFLKMFGKHNAIHGFRLAQLAYESLEDVLVLRMSRAIYPDLPADMLTALQHRTRAYKNSEIVSESNTSPKNSSTIPYGIRKPSNDYRVTALRTPLPAEPVKSILKDRLSLSNELPTILFSVCLSLFCLYVALWAVQRSLIPENVSPSGDIEQILQTGPFNYARVDDLYRRRIGFYVITDSSEIDTKGFLNKWSTNTKLFGTVNRNINDSDALIVAKIIQKSKDQVASIIFLDPISYQMIVLFEPHLAHAMTAGVKAALDYQYASSDTYLEPSKKFNIIRYHFLHPWHEIMQGYRNRRFFYGVGFGLAEGIATGILVISPIRHRLESRESKLGFTYWFAMSIFDLTISLVLVLGYTLIIALMESVDSMSTHSVTILVLILYKISALPVAYLVSLVADYPRNGFIFIFIVYTTIGWTFSTHVRTFVEWILYDEGYLYTVANWLTLVFPISAVIDSLTNIYHIARVNLLCPKIPAFTATGSLIRPTGVQKESLTDELLYKVQECLRNGKKGISTSMLHPRKFGILWCVCLITLFGILTWAFLLFSERVFGLIARRFASSRASNPTKTQMSAEPTHSLFKWDRERDRLVNDYVRCLNESGYVKLMAHNCLYLRLWLKPMGDQTSVDKRLAKFLEPLTQLGQPRNEVQVELKTTLQIFIRIGNESSRHRVDRIRLIETYASFVKENSNSLVKFAVVDWSKENLYKILLHGHYNTKTSSDQIK